jgi:hypothetical protein
VIAVAASLIPIAGVFQIFDGLQVVAAGVLRGAGDTRAAMISNVLGFWLVGMPVPPPDSQFCPSVRSGEARPVPGGRSSS